MDDAPLFTTNGETYRNPLSTSISLYDKSYNRMIILWNRIGRKLIHMLQQHETNTIICTITEKPMKVFCDYPIVDGLIIYNIDIPNSNLQRGIDYEPLLIRHQIYYLYPITLSILQFLLHKTKDEIETLFIPGRIYKDTSFLSIANIPFTSIYDFVNHSRSLYRNGSIISNYINHWYRNKQSIQKWVTIVDKNTTSNSSQCVIC